MENTSDFFEAISKGDLSKINSLVAENTKLATARNENGVPAILYSLYQQQNEIAERLLAEKPVLDIFEAAATGKIKRLTSLLESDCSLSNTEASDGARPLHLACFFSKTEAVKLLLNYGAQTNIAVAAFGGVYPLHSAAASRSAEIVEVLLEAGADPNTAQNGGWTALHAAAMHGDVEMTEALLTHGASASQKNDEGISPQQLPEAGNNPRIIELLKAAR